MNAELLPVRIAERFRLMIAGLGVVVIFITAANLFFRIIGDSTVTYAAYGVGTLAAAYFLSAVFNARFQRAVLAANSDRRSESFRRGGIARLGFGFQVGDHLLFGVSLPLMGMFLVAANYYHRAPATALLFATFALCALAQISLFVRDASLTSSGR